MKHRIAIVIFFLAMSFGLAQLAKDVKFDNYEWMDKDNPDQVIKDYLDQEFSPGEDLIVGLELKVPYFKQRTLDQLHEITQQIEAIDLVNDVETPLSATIVKGSRDVMRIESYHEAIEQQHFNSLSEYEAHLKSSPFWGRLISTDQQHISLVVTCDIDPLQFSYESREHILSEVGRILNAQDWIKGYHFSGELQLSHQIDVQTKENLKRLIALSIGIVLLFLFLIFRNVIKVLIVASSAGITVLATLVIVSSRGHPVTAVGLILPVVIIVIAIADSIHILTRWELLRQKISDPYKLLKTTMKETWVPCLVTSLTTGIGFGAFYFSEVIPLRNFGTDGFLTVFTAYILIIGISWGGIYVFQGPLSRSKTKEVGPKIKAGFNAIHLWTQQFWKPILGVSLGLVLIFGVMLRNIYTETNFLDVFFKKQSETYQSFKYIDRYLGGSGSIDIVLSSDDPGHYKNVTAMTAIKAIEKELVKHPKINHVQSYLNPLEMVHAQISGEGRLPKSNEGLSQEILFLEFSRGEEKNDVLSKHIDFDYANARIHLQTPNISANETTKILNDIDKIMEKTGFPGYFYGGSSVFFKALSGYILHTQLLSIALTLCAIWLMFMAIFGVKLGSLGMIPNIIPITMTLGLIAMLNVPFDFATVLISSISFGICVDDSIHFVHYYKMEKDRGVPFEKRTRKTVQILGYPILLTTVLLCIGFGVFMTGNLVLLVKFGIFTVFAISVAFIADIIILPAALRAFDSKA